MGDAAGDIGPGRRALGGNQIGDVVEGDDMIAADFLFLFRRDAHVYGALAATPADGDLAMVDSQWTFERRGDQFGKLRHDRFDLLADKLNRLIIAAFADELRGERVEHENLAGGIHADHAGRHARKNRFREHPAFIVQPARRKQTILLKAQFRCHLVEGLAKMSEVAVPGTDRHLHVEIGPLRPDPSPRSIS